MTPTHSNCQNLNFKSADDFHAWRHSVHLSPVSGEPAEAECACIGLYLNALIESSSPVLAWPVRLTDAPGSGHLISFGGEPDFHLVYTAIEDPPHPAGQENPPSGDRARRRWFDLFRKKDPQKEPGTDDTGNRLEHEWAALALAALRHQLFLLNSPGVRKYDWNELILNTLIPHPDLDMRVAVDLLGISLNKESADSRYYRLFNAITFVYDSLTIPRALAKRKI